MEASAEKVCAKCNQSKLIGEFYDRTRKCKECTKEDVRKNYASKRGQYSDYEKNRQQDPDRRKRKMDYQRQHRKKHPDKYKARQSLGNAVKRGRIVKLPCRVCGNPRSQAHHHDYSKPLDVDWLCFKCHRQEAHGQSVTQDFNLG